MAERGKRGLQIFLISFLGVVKPNLYRIYVLFVLLGQRGINIYCIGERRVEKFNIEAGGASLLAPTTTAVAHQQRL